MVHADCGDLKGNEFRNDERDLHTECSEQADTRRDRIIG